MYKATLKFFDGHQETTPVPGFSDKNGTVYIPENITINDRFFRLCKTQNNKDNFIYHEMELPENAEVIPDDRILH